MIMYNQSMQGIIKLLLECYGVLIEGFVLLHNTQFKQVFKYLRSDRVHYTNN